MPEKKRASRWQDPVPPGAPGAPVLSPPKVVIPTNLTTPPTAIPSSSTSADLAAAVAAAPDTTTAAPSTTAQQPPHSGPGPGFMPASSGPPMPLAVAASILSAAGLRPQGGPPMPPGLCPQGGPPSGANMRAQGMPPPAALAAMLGAANMRPQAAGGGMPPAVAQLLAAATGMRLPPTANAGCPPGGGGGGGPGMNGGMPMMLNAAMSLLNRFQPAMPPTAPPPGMQFGPGNVRRGCGPPGGVNNPAVQRVLQRLPQRPNQPRSMMPPQFNFMEVSG